MSREFPDFVDPWRAAEGGRRIGGTIPLARLSRLAPLLASNEGVADFSLLFGYDVQRRPTVAVQVSAPLSLVCQRSLEPYTEEIRQQSLLQVIGTLAEQAMLSGEEEYVLADEGRLAVAELVEDELLLAVPQVPRNPAVEPVRESTAGGDKHDPSSNGDSGRQRPFEALNELMKNR